MQAWIGKCDSHVLGVAQYGGSDAGSGYVFQNLGADGNQTFNTTALDLTAAGDTSSYYLVTGDAGCTKTP